MARKLFIAVLMLLGLGIAMPDIRPVSTFLGVQEAQAQQVKKKRKTLFDVLFKKRKKKKATKKKVNRANLKKLPGVSGSKKKIRKTASKTTRKKKSTRAVKPQVIKVKNENAASILVVGDFMASGLASGLERLYSDNPNIVIINKANAASGIVRDDVIDWPATIPTLIEEIKPIAIVHLSGMNDRQQMRVETGRVEKLSEEWLTEYNKRVETIAVMGQANNIPMVWVGIPPVRSGKMNSDYLAFNEIYRTKVEAAGAVYVDVWDGFTNAEGKFVSAGPDINGQIVRLRGSKGITMVRAGKQKLAFFADKALKRIGILGEGNGVQFASLGTINLGNAQPQVPEYDPVGTGKTVVISLGSPISDGGNVLEGEKDFLKKNDGEKSVSFSLVEKGIGYEPKTGRIDSSWGKPTDIPEVKPVEVVKDKSEKLSENTSEPKPLPKVTNVEAATDGKPQKISVQN